MRHPCVLPWCRLQNLFNHHIFIMEQAQYKAEGVDVTTIEFINNQPCVDMIEKKPMGILPMLDEVRAHTVWLLMRAPRRPLCATASALHLVA